MKKFMLILALCCVFCTAFAETSVEPAAAPTPTPLQSSTDDFLSNLGNTWDSFLNMAGEAGSALSDWGQGAAKDVEAFIHEKMPELESWLQEAGQYFDENVSPELSAAWDVLVENAAELGTHTQEEVQKAYAAIDAWLKQAPVDSEVREAVENVAEAAGADVEAPETEQKGE